MPVDKAAGPPHPLALQQVAGQAVPAVPAGPAALRTTAPGPLREVGRSITLVGRIAAQHLRVAVRDRVAFFWLLALPVVFTWLVSMAFGTGPGSDGVPRYHLPAADLDGSVLSRRLGQLLATDPSVAFDPTNPERVRAAVDARDVRVGLIIPKGFEAAVRAGGGVVSVVQRPGEVGNDPRAYAIELAMDRLAVEVAAGRAAQATAGLSWDEAIRLAIAQSSTHFPAEVRVEPVQITEGGSDARRLPSGAEQASPGFAVMFILLGAVTVTGTLVAERRQGTLARLLCAPMWFGHVVAGKMLAAMLQGLIQLALLVAAGQWLFGVQWGRSPLALSALGVAYTAAAAALGLLMAAVVRTESQAGSMGTLLVILLSLLGGAWWPMEVVSPAMQSVAWLVPTGWAMDGFLDIVLRGANLPVVLPNVLALLGFAAAFAVAGVMLFRYES